MSNEAAVQHVAHQLRAAYRLVLSWPNQDGRSTSDNTGVLTASGDSEADKEEQTQQINAGLTSTFLK